jgi:hypothetical protein
VVASDFHMALDRLENAFADAGRHGIGTMVLVGDSCDGQEPEYAAIRRKLATSPHPRRLFFTMGNHEYYAAFHRNGGEYLESGFPNGETSQACRERFNRFRGAPPGAPVYYDAWVAGFHFLFLGGERSRMDSPEFQDDAVLTPAQLRWLEEKLAEGASPAKPIFVFLHQPLPGTVSGSGNGTSVRPAGDLKALYARYPQVIQFSGDSHWQLALPTTRYRDPANGYNLFNTSSLRDPYDERDQPIATPMSEGLVVEVRPGKVLVRGRDFLHHADVQGQRYTIRLP